MIHTVYDAYLDEVECFLSRDANFLGVDERNQFQYFTQKLGGVFHNVKKIYNSLSVLDTSHEIARRCLNLSNKIFSRYCSIAFTKENVGFRRYNNDQSVNILENKLFEVLSVRAHIQLSDLYLEISSPEPIASAMFLENAFQALKNPVVSKEYYEIYFYQEGLFNKRIILINPKGIELFEKIKSKLLRLYTLYPFYKSAISFKTRELSKVITEIDHLVSLGQPPSLNTW